jgi:SWI/SNF-related matrix-associated actin-dependent regulator of chromatin subfamily A3
MQTIALICTDDTGEGVLEGGPEEPDERYDDMTLIGEQPAHRSHLTKL